MYILGISAFYHDSAAALICDGRIIAAAQEERFTRKKHDQDFPSEAIAYCLKEAGITLADIDHVAFYDKPFLKFERLLETYIAYAPMGYKSFARALPLWIKDKLFQKKNIVNAMKASQGNNPGIEKNILFAEHHQSHAASAFFPSPFEEAVVLTMDGVGEWATTSVAIGRGNKLEIVKEIHFPHSLGLLYSAFTYYTGFKVNSGEYKVMGLAPYGSPIYKEVILKHLVDLKDDGSYRLNMRYFNYCTGLTMVNERFEKLFGHPTRKSDEELTQFHMDMAASVQSVLEEIVLRMTNSLATEYKIPNLCLAGGVALNCVANGKILKQNAFKNVWVQPASGDAGGSLGAALAAYHIHLKRERQVVSTDAMKGSYLGPEFSDDQISSQLTSIGARFHRLPEDEVIEKTVDLLEQGMSVGWFQGRMEFGPRALGNRSIIADPRPLETQKNLNLKIKFRESFRPFAPAVLREEVQNWFDFSSDSPYMLMVSNVHKDKQVEMTQQEKSLFGIEKLNTKRSSVPSVTHVDYSARLQTVHRETNQKFHQLIKTFQKKTGFPILVNTSFNVRGEPIVCTPKDAFRCFMGTDLDILVVGNCFLYKEEQNETLKLDYKNQFELD